MPSFEAVAFVPETSVSGEVQFVRQTVDKREFVLSYPHASFTTFRVSHGVALLFEKHLNRLVESAVAGGAAGDVQEWRMNIRMVLTSALHDVDAACHSDLRVTVILPLDSPLSVAVYVEETPQAASLCMVTSYPIHRDNPGAKLTSWARQREAVVKRCKELYPDTSEVLLIHDNCYLEGASSNFFAFFDSQIYTASEQDGVLNGTIRQLVCECCKLPLVQVAPKLSDSFDAAFITSTTREIQPISRIIHLNEDYSIREVVDLPVHFDWLDNLISDVHSLLHQRGTDLLQP